MSREPIAVEESKEDVAEISMRLGERSLMRLFDHQTGQTRDFVRASAVSLALWFIDNWWRLRWEPIPDYQAITADWRLRHEITSSSGGTVWPPLMIYGVGARVVLAPIAVALRQVGPVEYLPMQFSLMPGTTYEEGVDAFVKEVAATCARATDGPVLRSLVGQLWNERQNIEVAAWRRLEAKLGYDPDCAPDDVIEALLKQEEDVGADAIEEAAVSSPGASAPKMLERAVAAVHESQVKIDVGAAVTAAKPVNHTDLDRPIWMVAEDAAARLRHAIGRVDGPLLNTALSDILKVTWQSVMNAIPTARSLAYGARLRGDGTLEKVALQTRSAHDRRFELARVLGDSLWSFETKLGIVSRSKTDRQKFQRAFAQSLLCPFEDIRHHVDLAEPTEAQIEVAARRYHVHKNVVRTLLVNKGFLPRETLGDHLEAA